MRRLLAVVLVVCCALASSRAAAQNPINLRTPNDTVVTDSVQTFTVDICTSFLRDTSAFLVRGPVWTPLFMSDGPAAQCGGSGFAFFMDATLQVGTSYVVVEIVDVNYTPWRDSIAVIYQLPGGGPGAGPSGQPEVTAPASGGVTFSPGEYRLLHFAITNVSAGIAAFTGSLSCTGVVTACQVEGASTFVTGDLASGQAKSVAVGVQASATPGTGTVRLIASGTIADTGFIE